MTPPAMLPQLSAASSVRSAPMLAPRGDAAPSPFEQHLQAARGAQPAGTPPPTDPPPASTPTARAKGDSSSTDAAAKPAQESNVSTVTTASTTATASAANAQPIAATAPRGSTDTSLVNVALLAAQTAPVAVEAGDAAAATEAKTADSTKTATPDEEAAATLAGAMLAMLGQVTNGVPGAKSAADDVAVSADGAASGQAKAAVMPQALVLDDQATAAIATPAANLAGVLGGMERALAASSTDTRKEHGLEALALVAGPAPTPTPATPSLPQLQLSSPPDSPGFAGELGQQVVWLGQQDIRQAKIRLHPEELGSIDVHLSVNHDRRVDVVFSAQHPAAVTAVQQSLPQLDHMLARHGLSLGHAEVGQQQNRGDDRARDEGRGASTAADEIGEVHGASRHVATGRIGLLDAFA